MHLFKTSYNREGGGDMPGTNIYTFKYQFYDKWYHRFLPHRSTLFYEFTLPDTSSFNQMREKLALSKYEISELSFLINNVDVLEWAKEQPQQGAGKVTFYFEFDYSIEHVIFNGLGKHTARIRFSDKSMAMLFKLTFGASAVET